MMPPCKCKRFVVSNGFAEPYVEGRDCRPCFLFATNPMVNKVWGGDGKLIPVRNVPRSASKGKPRMSFSEMNEKLRKCKEAKARGDECKEFTN